jgi:transcriptional/translational regulatory protein YebC/TACO1
VESAKIGYRPKNPQSLSGEQRQEVETFLASIHEHDDVQEVYVALEG